MGERPGGAKRHRPDGADNGGPLGEDDLCRRYNTPEGCVYGDKCRFRHGPSDNRELGSNISAQGSKTKPCTKFFSTSGCPYGESCHFSHYVPGGISSLGLGVGPATPSHYTPAGRPHGGHSATPGSPQNLGGFKTRLCNKFATPEGCRFGSNCHFAHGEVELRRGSLRSPAPHAGTAGQYASSAQYPTYGSSMGAAYGADAGVLPYGDYTASVYNQQASVSYGGLGGTENGQTAAPESSSASYAPAAAPSGLGVTATRMRIEVGIVGAIIGKMGANVKNICRTTGAKVSVRDHESDPNVRNVEMEGTPEQIEHARHLIQQYLAQREGTIAKPYQQGPHNFKTKMCENFIKGSCSFGDRCHFAHGTSDLRELTPSRGLALMGSPQ